MDLSFGAVDLRAAAAFSFPSDPDEDLDFVFTFLGGVSDLAVPMLRNQAGSIEVLSL